MTAPARKPDAAKFRKFIAEQTHAWAQTLYRFDDVTNMASILRRGVLYSRARADELGITHLDCANQGVISLNVAAHKNVRLFFRPRTPTQYNMEGIQHPAMIREGAHMPVPVFLLFDRAEIVTRAGVSFADGTLARRYEHHTGDDFAFYKRLPWDDIYHDRGYPPGSVRGDEIKNRRQAEVTLRDQLPLEGALREIVCRSHAERLTLLNLLGDAVERFRSIVRVERPAERLFEKRWLFVKEMRLAGGKLDLTFNVPVKDVGDAWECELLVRDAFTGRLVFEVRKEKPSFVAREVVRISERLRAAHVKLLIEGNLAFSGILLQAAGITAGVTRR